MRHPSEQTHDVRDARSLKSRQETTNHCGNGEFCNNFTARGGEGTQHTNLDSNGTKVGEPAQRVGCDGVGTRRQSGVGLHQRLEIQVCRKLVGNELGSQEPGDWQNLGTRHTQEECNGVEYVSEDQLQRQGMDAETAANPCEQTVNHSDKR